MTERRRRSGRRLTAGTASVLGHLAVLAVVLTARVEPPPQPPELAPMTVMLLEPPPPPPPPPPPAEVIKPAEPAPKPPAKAKPPPKRIKARAPRRAPPPEVAPLPASDREAADAASELSDAEVADAATAGSGGGSGAGPGGGSCNMTRRLQTALRKDARVRQAAAEAHNRAGGKALLVWNGDWVRTRGQEGAGLAAVRETIMWEVAFAPKECRSEAVRGRVLLSLNDGPGSARIVMGAGAWRWTDLLHARRGG